MNDNAKQICAEYEQAECVGCPIATACAGVKGDNQGRWELRLNNAADKVVGA
jgi:hypothetical protein